MKRWMWILLFVALGIIFARTPYSSDDYGAFLQFYGTDLPGTGFSDLKMFWSAIGNVGRLPQIVWEGWWTFLGRVLPIALNPLMTAVPRSVYGVLNSLLFCGLIYLILDFSRVRKSVPAVALLVFTLLQSDAVVWLTGSIFYLWPLMFTMVSFRYCWQADGGDTRSATADRILLLALTMFVVACGHEQISVPVSLALLSYWIIVYKNGEKFSRRRLGMTFGYWLGTAVVSFSPGSIHRALAEGGGSVAYNFLVKVIAVGHMFILNPWFYVLLILCVIAYKTRCHFSARVRWVALCYALVVLFGLFFSSPSPRAAWFSVCLSALLSLSMINEMAGVRWSCWGPVGRSLAVVCGITTIVSTLVANELNRSEIAHVMDKWRMSGRAECEIPESSDWILSVVFDRSRSDVIQVGKGQFDSNKTLAMIYGKESLIGVRRNRLKVLQNIKSICVPGNQIDFCGGWYVVRDSKMLVSECGKESLVGNYATISARVESCAKRKNIVDAFSENLRRCCGGWGVFAARHFFASFLRDVLYATVYSNAPVKGMVFKDKDQFFNVLMLDHWRYPMDTVSSVRLL